MARARRGGWQADVRLPNGKRLRQQFRTQAQAEVWEAATKLAAEEGKPLPGTATGRVGQRDLTTWGGLFEHTKRHIWSDCRAADNLIRNGRLVVEFFGSNTMVKTVTRADLEDFAAHLQDDVGNSAGTINRKLAAASRMLSVALTEGVIDFKIPIPRKREGEGRTRYLSELEEAAMLNYWRMTSDTLNLHLTEFLIDTGARAFSEAGQTRWEDITDRGVTFYGYDSRGTKNGTIRTVPLTARAKAACEAMRGSNPDGPFFNISTSRLRSRWNHMRANLKFHDVTPHVLRHTCACRFAMRGIDLLRIRDWLGHKSIEMTMRYARLAPNALEGMVDIVNRWNPESGDQNGAKTVPEVTHTDTGNPTSPRLYIVK